MNWLVFILSGKLLIYLGQQFPLPDFLERNEKIKKWHECDLCFGCWCFFGLALFMKMDIFSILGIQTIFIISPFITGCVISFLVHIFSIGWRDKFSPEIVI